MSKDRSYSPPSKPRVKLEDAATKKEIDRQHALLSADMDKKQLKGNVKLEDWRYHRHTTSLTQKEKREHCQIKTERKELLNDLKKVRSSYTGHYDDTKSPLENIQLALRTKCLTPQKSSRLEVRSQAMRRCKSSEALSSQGTRASSSLNYSAKPLSLGRDKAEHQMRKDRPKTAAPVISTSKRR